MSPPTSAPSGPLSGSYERGRAGRLMKLAKAAAVAGCAFAVAGTRSRTAARIAGALFLAGSAVTRFGVFHAGIDSANDPRHTIQPQRERLARAGSASR